LKRLFLFGAAMVFVGSVIVATPGPGHKIDWCHFPPGQYPNKALILSVDVASTSDCGLNVSGQHMNHLGDGPVADVPLGNDCVPNKVPGLGPTCSAVQQCGLSADGYQTTGTPGNCLCPTNVLNCFGQALTRAGLPPDVNGKCDMALCL